MITGSNVLTILVIVALFWVVFFAPINIPSWLRTLFGILLAVVAFLWLLSLLGVLVL